MKTNYQQLNLFEVCTVMMIFVGVILIGFYMYLSTPSGTQKNLASAVELLDVSAGVPQILDNVAFIVDSQEEFYDQFYLAFTQVATVPFDNVHFNTDAVFGFAEQVAANYTEQNKPKSIQSNNQILTLNLDLGIGKVLGASIDLPEQPILVKNCHSEIKIEEVEVSYSYVKPKINLEELARSMASSMIIYKRN